MFEIVHSLENIPNWNYYVFKFNNDPIGCINIRFSVAAVTNYTNEVNKIQNVIYLLNKLNSKDSSNAEKLFTYKQLCESQNGLKLTVMTESKFINKDELGVGLFDLLTRPKYKEPFSAVQKDYTNEFIKAISLKELL
jgi:hypothetical protein